MFNRLCLQHLHLSFKDMKICNISKAIAVFVTIVTIFVTLYILYVYSKNDTLFTTRFLKQFYKPIKVFNSTVSSIKSTKNERTLQPKKQHTTAKHKAPLSIEEETKQKLKWSQECRNIIPSEPLTSYRGHYAMMPKTSKQKALALQEVTRKLNLTKVFFTVKSTKRYHRKRLQVLLDTWISMVPHQTYVVSDGNDTQYQKSLPDGHLVSTSCNPRYGRNCCKTGIEFDLFMNSSNRHEWWCKCDDDTYWNLHSLQEHLLKYNASEKQLIGCTGNMKRLPKIGPVIFPFGSAGTCMSRTLAKAIQSNIGDGQFAKLCATIKAGEDVAIGYAAMHFGNKKTTNSPVFNKHNNDIKHPNVLSKQVSYCYRDKTLKFPYTGQVQLKDFGFSAWDDPTRFYSLHAWLYPHIPMCKLPKRTSRYSFQLEKNMSDAMILKPGWENTE